jgi:predicted ABC-type ATPase
VERRRSDSDPGAIPGVEVKVGRIGRSAREPFDPDAFDADGDGKVQDGTVHERPATPKAMGAVAAAREAINKNRAKKGKPPATTAQPKKKPAKKAPTQKPKKTPEKRPTASMLGMTVGVSDDIALTRRQERSSKPITRTEAGRDAAKDVVRTLATSMDDLSKRRHGRQLKPRNSPTLRKGKKTDNPLQQMGKEAAQVRDRRAKAFPAAVPPPSVKPKKASVKEMVAAIRKKGEQSTASFWKLQGRGLDQPDLDPDRAEIYDTIARALVYGDADNPIELPKKDNPVAYLMGGGSGSGKSFLRRAGFFEVPDRMEAAHVDPDEGRAMIPEYDDIVREIGENDAGRWTHVEASHISTRATNLALEGRHDLVLDGTGDGGTSAFVGRIEQMREAGYRIVANYATVSLDKAHEAAEKRRIEEGRGVPPDVLEDIHIDVSRALLRGLVTGSFDEITLVDNEDYEHPVIFAEFRDGHMEVYNVDLFYDFISKALQRSPFESRRDYEHYFDDLRDLIDEMLREMNE